MNHSNHNSKMMWWMMVGCLLPIALILILGGAGISKNWIWIGAIALMFGMHAMMMSGHKHSDEKEAEDDQPATKATQIPDNHEHH